MWKGGGGEGGWTFRLKTMSEVRMVLAMVVAWYANISLRPGPVMARSLPTLERLPLLPLLLLLCLFGCTIQSMASASSLPYRRVPCAPIRYSCMGIACMQKLSESSLDCLLAQFVSA